MFAKQNEGAEALHLIEEWDVSCIESKLGRSTATYGL